MNRDFMKRRLKEAIIDYFVILAYLILLFFVNVIIIYTFFDGIPDYSEIQAQLVATFTSVIPIILIFSYLDFFNKGSFGKKLSGLKLVYSSYRYRFSLLRNIIKFLPWQLGHLGVIHGMYSNFDSTAVIIASFGCLLGIIWLLMAFIKKDKRHPGDVLAGTRVEVLWKSSAKGEVYVKSE